MRVQSPIQQLTDAAPDEFATVFSFSEEIGLPTTLADIGLGEVDRQKLMLVAENATDQAQFIHHELLFQNWDDTLALL